MFGNYENDDGIITGWDCCVVSIKLMLAMLAHVLFFLFFLLRTAMPKAQSQTLSLNVMRLSVKMVSVLSRVAKLALMREVRVP